MSCKGITWSNSFGVTATGWVYLDGSHVTREEVQDLIEARGATFHPEFCNQTDLLILGELQPYQIRDDRQGGVNALEQLILSRRNGEPHVHLASFNDLADLLDGERIPCRKIPRKWATLKKRPRTAMRRGYQ